MPFRPSPCSHRAVFLAHTNRIDRVFFSKSSLGHITGCKENALEFPLIWSHNDDFRPDNKPYEGKIRAFRRYSSSRGEIQEIRIAKEKSYLLLLQPPVTSCFYDRRWREEKKPRPGRKVVNTKYKRRHENETCQDWAPTSIYRLRAHNHHPPACSKSLDEKFLTKRKNHEVVNFVDEKNEKRSFHSQARVLFSPLLLFLDRVKKKMHSVTGKQNTDADRRSEKEVCVWCARAHACVVCVRARACVRLK